MIKLSLMLITQAADGGRPLSTGLLFRLRAIKNESNCQHELTRPKHRWTLGILIHELLTGHAPFESSDPQQTNHKILQGIRSADLAKYGRSEPYAADLVKNLLVRNPGDRLPMRKGGEYENLKNHLENDCAKKTQFPAEPALIVTQPPVATVAAVKTSFNAVIQ